MTKKYFNALAWELAAVRLSIAVDGRLAFCVWQNAVKAVVTVCQESNPAFQLDRFWSACMGTAEIRNGKRHLAPAK